MNRFACLLGILAILAFGGHGALMSARQAHGTGSHPASHHEPLDSACPMGFVCPLASGELQIDLDAFRAFVGTAALALLAFAALTFLVRLPYRPPLLVFANSGPPVVLKSIKRE